MLDLAVFLQLIRITPTTTELREQAEAVQMAADQLGRRINAWARANAFRVMTVTAPNCSLIYEQDGVREYQVGVSVLFTHHGGTV